MKKLLISFILIFAFSILLPCIEHCFINHQYALYVDGMEKHIKFLPGGILTKANGIVIGGWSVCEENKIYFEVDLDSQHENYKFFGTFSGDCWCIIYGDAVSFDNNVLRFVAYRQPIVIIN
jgi:hypothetical protein